MAEQTRNPTALLRRRQVEAQTGLARSTLYKLIRELKFPRPVQITDGGAVAWRSTDVDAWIQSRVSVS